MDIFTLWLSMNFFGHILIVVFTTLGLSVYGQSKMGTQKVNGEILYYIITDEGDTLILADDLPPISISSPRKFKDKAEENKYKRYKRYAIKVYPLATKAIQLYREMEVETAGMSKRKRRKYVKRRQKELEEKFKEPLKQLSRNQGKFLVEMIEKELNIPFFKLLNDIRGRFTAGYWNTFSYMFGYRLKHGYITGEDPILDAVISDFDISYEIPPEEACQ